MNKTRTKRERIERAGELTALMQDKFTPIDVANVLTLLENKSHLSLSNKQIAAILSRSSKFKVCGTKRIAGLAHTMSTNVYALREEQL